nr:DUF2206 domain-containing protein [uncultured Methanobacterium sp.]
MGFITLNFIPGLLILHILKMDKVGWLEKFLLSVSLSVSLLLFMGLLINSFYPLISKPISLIPLLIGLNIVICFLMLCAYHRTEDKIKLNLVKPNLEGKYLFIPLISLLLPIISIIGTILMNYYEINTFLLLLFILIPSYIVLITYFREKTPNFTYPLAILMISLSLCLMHGLRSTYVTPIDSSIELYVLKLTISNSHWSIASYGHNYNSCLSLTILPGIYSIILGIKEVYVYKVLYNLLFALVPLVSFTVFRKYLNSYYAFLAAFLLMSQHIFISMYGWLGFRQTIASLFFAIAVMVIFEDNFRMFNKKILIILFMFSLILSNYSTAYIFFIAVFSSWILSIILENRTNISYSWIKEILKGKVRIKHEFSIFQINMMILFLVLMFVWYSQATATPFNETALFLKNNVINILQMALEGLKNEETLFSTKNTLADQISYVIYYISFFTIALGVFEVIKKKTKISTSFSLMMIVSFALLAFLSVTSVFIEGFGVSRAYQELLIFLAPAFIIGALAISKYSTRWNKKFNWIIILLLILQFSSASHMVYQICGENHSEFLNSNGPRFESYYIQDKDYSAANWLYNHNPSNSSVAADYSGYYIYGQFDMMHLKRLSTDNVTKNDFIYLRTANIQNKHVYSSYTEYDDISHYSALFINKKRLYDNGGAVIYK